ncbi:hypothetical protein GGX14DRAFT_362431, partial [Mycena pura]
VITMYTRGGGKAGAHSILPICDNIGVPSYLLVQIFEQNYRRQFRQTRQKDMQLGIKHFAHITSASFLAQIPDPNIKASSINIDVGPAAYEIFQALHNEREKIGSAVATLNTVWRKGGQTISVLDFEEPEHPDREDEAGGCL